MLQAYLPILAARCKLFAIRWPSNSQNPIFMTYDEGMTSLRFHSSQILQFAQKRFTTHCLGTNFPICTKTTQQIDSTLKHGRVLKNRRHGSKLPRSSAQFAETARFRILPRKMLLWWNKSFALHHRIKCCTDTTHLETKVSEMRRFRESSPYIDGFSDFPDR